MRARLALVSLVIAALPLGCGGDDAPLGAPDGAADVSDGNIPSSPDSASDQAAAPDGGTIEGGPHQDGPTPDGSLPEGSPPDGALMDGSAPDGPPPDGSQLCTSSETVSIADGAALFPYQLGARWRFQVAGSSDLFSGGDTTFLQERAVIGTRTVGTTTALVLQTSNSDEEDGPVQDYLAVLPSGLFSFGNDGVPGLLNFGFYALPYPELAFPIDGCATVVPFERAGIDIGADLDGDGIDESVAYRVTTALHVEDVTVPVGTFPGALRVETTIESTATYSKTGPQSLLMQTQVDWYAAGVGPIKRWRDTGARTYDYELVAYTVGGVSHGVLPSGALARDIPQTGTNPYQPNRPAIGFDGAGFLVVVPTMTPSTIVNLGLGNLQSFVVGADGTAQMGSALLPANATVSDVVTAFDGTEHMLAYDNDDTHTVEAMPVSTSGSSLGNPVTVSNNMPTIGNPETSGGPTIVATSSGFLLAYTKVTTVPGTILATPNVWMVPVDRQGSPGTYVEPFPSTTQGQVFLATDGSTILALWSEYGTLLLASRFDAAGNALDATPLLVSSGQADSLSDVELIFDGTQFVAFWTANRIFGGGSVRAARIGKDLTFLDGPPSLGGVPIGGTGKIKTGPRIARLGTGSLVLWDTFSSTPPLNGVVVSRFTTDGRVPETQGLADGILSLGPVAGAPFSQNPLPEILWGADRALVVWLYPPADSQSASFGLDYGFAYPWQGGGPGTGGGDGGTDAGAADGGDDGGVGADSDAGQGVICGFTMPNPASAGLPNAASYDTLAGMVVDEVSGLTWERQLSGAAAVPGCTLDGGGLQLCSQASAASYCAANRVGGFADWRLPTVAELFSLVDYTVTAPALDQTAFPGTASALFWSATPVAPATTGGGWTVDFQQGSYQQTSAQESHNVRCVRGSAPPSHCAPTGSRFQLQNDMATDATTGLVWQSYGGAELSWEDASASCALQGMRLPSIKEAMTLLDFAQSSSSGGLIDRNVFPDVGGGFWATSTAVPGQVASTWVLSRSDGVMIVGSGTSETRCVR